MFDEGQIVMIGWTKDLAKGSVARLTKDKLLCLSREEQGEVCLDLDI